MVLLNSVCVVGTLENDGAEMLVAEGPHGMEDFLTPKLKFLPHLPGTLAHERHKMVFLMTGGKRKPYQFWDGALSDHHPCPLSPSGD